MKTRNFVAKNLKSKSGQGIHALKNGSKSPRCKQKSLCQLPLS